MLAFLVMLVACFGVAFLFGYIIFTLLFLLGAALCGEPLPSLPKVAGTTAMAMVAASMANFVLGVVLYLSIDALGGLKTDHVIFHAADIVSYVAMWAVTVAIWGAVYNNALDLQVGGSIALFQAAVFIALDLLMGGVMWLFTEQFPVQGPLARIANSEALIARDEQGIPTLRNPFTIARQEEPTAAPPPAPTAPVPAPTTPLAQPTPPPSSAPPATAETPPATGPPAETAPMPPETTAATTTEPAPAETTPAPTPPPEPSNALERRAAASFAAGQELDGFRLLWASLVVDDRTPLWDRYRWCAALGRPALALRFGLAVEDRSASDVRPLDAGGWQSAAGSAAEPLVAALAGHALAGGPIAAGHTGQPPLLGTGTRDALRAAAADANLDVLVLAGSTGGRLEVRLIDVGTARELSAAGPASVAASDAGPAKELVDAVRLYLQVNLRLAAGAPLAADRARARAASVAGSQPANPLAALAELRYYQRLGVLTADQAAGDYARLVGESNAESLAGSDAGEREQAIERWLP
jgi:hypothetical protein